MRAQKALILGSDLGSALEDHVADCSECAFFRSLSYGLSGLSWSSGHEDEDPLAAFIELMERAAASGARILSRYRVLGRIGRGGQGIVFRALDAEAANEPVALKLVRCHPERPEASALEVVHAHRVRHPGVCRVYHTERHGNLRWIVMELVDGESLARCAPSLSTRQRRQIFREVCEAVHAAHEAGVLHLDLKPQNVLVRGNGEPLVTDFGLSVLLGVEDGPAFGVGGTPAYMAPEQRDGRPVDRRTDVYALGALLRGLLPQPGRKARRVVQRAMMADPTRRYPDAAALLRDLEPSGRRRRWLLASAAAACLVAAFFLVPAPHGTRAHWDPRAWGPDTVPPDEWNVARNSGGDLPSIATDVAAVGCAQSLAELLDGAAQYTTWEHGYAFPGTRPLCISLPALGYCGALKEDAPLCVKRPGRPHETLAVKVRDRQKVRLTDGVLGQLEEGSDCKRDYTMTLTLERPSIVSAVRLWFRDGSARRYLVQGEDASGQWHNLFETWNDIQLSTRQQIPVPRDAAGGLTATSVPVLLELRRYRTRRLRVSVWCHDVPFNPKGPSTEVWLYEVEVFARLSRIGAWRRRLF